MKTCIALALLLFGVTCFAQSPADGKPRAQTVYPEPDAIAAWQGLAAGYLRKALKDRTLDRDPELNARVDAVMARVGAAVAAVDARFERASWKAILIEDFGYGAAAFPGETIILDAKFVRALRLGDDELALILSHEAAHLVCGHASVKLSFMAEYLGKENLPTARTALLEFLAKDSYALAYRPTAQLQEREADEIGAAIFFVSGYDSQRALAIFDKLVKLESGDDAQDADSHDTADLRKQAVSAVIEKLRQATPRTTRP